MNLTLYTQLLRAAVSDVLVSRGKPATQHKVKLEEIDALVKVDYSATSFCPTPSALISITRNSNGSLVAMAKVYSVEEVDKFFDRIFGEDKPEPPKRRTRKPRKPAKPRAVKKTGRRTRRKIK